MMINFTTCTCITHGEIIRRWEDSSKIDLREIDREYEKGTDLA